MGQFSFSCTLPHLIFLQKGKGPVWCCLSGCERSPDDTRCPFPLKQGVQLAYNVMSMWDRCFFHPWSADDPAFVGFERDSSHPTQIPNSLLHGQGLCSGSLISTGGSCFPAVSFRQPVPCVPSSPPITTCGTARLKVLAMFPCAGSSLSRLEGQIRK